MKRIVKKLSKESLDFMSDEQKDVYYEYKEIIDKDFDELRKYNDIKSYDSFCAWWIFGLINNCPEIDYYEFMRMVVQSYVSQNKKN